MKKLNPVVYHKLLLQSQEAKVQGMTKLASGIVGAVGPIAEDEEIKYSYQQLQDELYDGMWKLATHVLKYYDVKSADAGSLHHRLESLADQFLNELEADLNLDIDDIGDGPLDK